jgi:hypothetical protein
MGRRSAFVEPQVVRLQLADVRRRAAQALSEKTGKDKPTEAELHAACVALQEAEEDGYYIDVKRELNAGETKKVWTNLVRGGGFVQGEKPILDIESVGLTKALQYVVGWNLVTKTDEPVPFSEAALNNLRLDIYNDIMAAIDWHDENVERERTARKNDQATSRGLPATSGSPSPVTGTSTTSEA